PLRGDARIASDTRSDARQRAHDYPHVARRLGVEFDVPVEVIHPAFVQMVRREAAADMLQLMHRRPARTPERAHARMMDVLAALLQIAGRARRDDVLPRRAPAL